MLPWFTNTCPKSKRLFNLYKYASFYHSDLFDASETHLRCMLTTGRSRRTTCEMDVNTRGEQSLRWPIQWETLVIPAEGERARMVFHTRMYFRTFISIRVQTSSPHKPSRFSLSVLQNTCPVHALLGNRPCVHIMCVCVSAGALWSSPFLGDNSACEK